MRNLNTQKCLALARKGGESETRVAPSLYLRVRGGSADWQFKGMRDGKAQRVTIGRFDSVPLVDAVAQAADLRLRFKRGENVFAIPVAATQTGGDTFREVAEDLIQAMRPGRKNAKHADQWSNTLETYAYPLLGPMRVSEISTEHVLAVLSPIWNEKHETATRVRMRMEAVLRAAKARRLRTGENPAAWRDNLQALLPTISKKRRVVHHAAMPYADVPAYMHLLSTQTSISANALRLAILTACRTGEVIGATWPELDLDGALWTIPERRMKAQREHRVPLSRQAIALLRALPRMDGSDVVFWSPKSGPNGEVRPLSNMAMLELLRGDHDGMTVHGFRSSFRDWAAEATPFPSEVVEMALAHVVANQVEAAYRRGDLLDKRRELMQDWADHLDRLKAGGADVVPIRQSA